MISDNTYVGEDGSVNGTLKYVTGFEAFNSTEPSEQEGYFFPFTLTQTGTTMTFIKNGVPTKSDIAFDPEIIFRVDNNSVTWKVEVDGQEVVTLNFANATFE